MESNISSQPQTPEVKNPIEYPVSSTPANPSSKAKYILIAVLVLLVLFAVGGGAYYLGVKNQSSSQNNNQITATIKPSPTLTSVPTIQPSPTSGKSSSSFLEITELNVKLNISQLPGLTYKYKINSTGDKTAVLYTQDLAAYCSPDAADAPLGVIFKINGQYSDSPLPKPGELLKQFGNYFISYRAPQQQCTNNSTGGQLQGEQEQAVKSIISSLESL